MGFRGHALVTVLFFLAIVLFGRMLGVSWPTFGMGGMFMLLGGLFPDIDTAGRGRRFFSLILLAAIVCCLLGKFYVTAAVLLAVTLVPLLVRHRTIFHNFYFLAFLTALFCWVFFLFLPHWWWGIVTNGAFFLVGCWGHLVADFGFLKSLNNRF